MTFFALAAFTITVTSCGEKDTEPNLIGAEVTISNTLQTAADPSMGGTGGVETPIELIFGLPEAALFATTEVDENVEFQAYLDGLYDVDISENTISYELVADEDHPVYSAFFRTIEANTFDRYYLVFDQEHNIESGTTTNSSVSLSVISETEVMVQISEGFDFNPGTTFTINLN